MNALAERLQQIADDLSETQVWVVCGVVSMLIIIFGSVSAYSSEDQLPDPGPPPPRPKRQEITNYRYLPKFYKSLIDEDTAKVGLQPTTVEQLAEGNRLRTEFTGAQRLRPKRGSLRTATLSIRATRKKMWVGGEGRRFRARHILLRITNRTNKHIAYRVTTKVRGDCNAKAIAHHNAIALAPKKSVTRTECLLGKRTKLKVTGVQTLQLTPLGYYYVSRLDPATLGLDTRTAEGHKPGKMPACRLLPGRTIADALRSGARWYDVVDFYSRHNCDEYSYYLSYRHSPEGPGKIPLRPPKR